MKMLFTYWSRRILEFPPSSLSGQETKIRNNFRRENAALTAGTFFPPSFKMRRPWEVETSEIRWNVIRPMSTSMLSRKIIRMLGTAFQKAREKSLRYRVPVFTFCWNYRWQRVERRRNFIHAFTQYRSVFVSLNSRSTIFSRQRRTHFFPSHTTIERRRVCVAFVPIIFTFTADWFDIRKVFLLKAPK